MSTKYRFHKPSAAYLISFATVLAPAKSMTIAQTTLGKPKRQIIAFVRSWRERHARSNLYQLL